MRRVTVPRAILTIFIHYLHNLISESRLAHSIDSTSVIKSTIQAIVRSYLVIQLTLVSNPFLWFSRQN